jgi:hypothetical protein
MKNTYETPLSADLIETVRKTVLEAAGHVVVALSHDTPPKGDYMETFKTYGADYHSADDKNTNFKVPAKDADAFRARMKSQHNVYSSIVSESAQIQEMANESKAANPLAPYKRKAVQGLHSYTHFEAPSGAFIQVRDGGEEHYVHQDSKGNRKTFTNIDALKKHVASTKEEVEPIEELSKATLGRYIKAASGDLIPKQRLQDRQFKSARDFAIDSKGGGYHAREGVKTGKKIQNHRDGIDKATDKLTKENKED